MTRAVVVGLGRIGAGFQRDPLRTGAVTHAGGWDRHPAVELAGGVDPDGDQRKAFEEFFGVPAFSTWAEAVAECDPRFVSVCTPPQSHRAVVNEVLESDVQRVIVEKPCTPDLSTAGALLNDLGDRVEMVGVNYTRRYDPLHRKLFGILAEEGVSGGTGHYTAGILNTGSHWLDGLHSAGAVVEEVYASARYEGPDPTPDVSLRLRGGGLVHLHAHDVEVFLIYETDLFGPTSRVQLINSGTEGRLYHRVPSAMYSGYHELRPPEAGLPLGLTNPLLPVVDDAVTSVQEGRGMRCSVADAVAVHRVIEGVHRSLKEGSWVRLTDRG